MSSYSTDCSVVENAYFCSLRYLTILFVKSGFILMSTVSGPNYQQLPVNFVLLWQGNPTEVVVLYSCLFCSPGFYVFTQRLVIVCIIFCNFRKISIVNIGNDVFQISTTNSTLPLKMTSWPRVYSYCQQIPHCLLAVGLLFTKLGRRKAKFALEPGWWVQRIHLGNRDS